MIELLKLYSKLYDINENNKKHAETYYSIINILFILISFVFSYFICHYLNLSNIETFNIVNFDIINNNIDYSFIHPDYISNLKNYNYTFTSLIKILNETNFFILSNGSQTALLEIYSDINNKISFLLSLYFGFIISFSLLMIYKVDRVNIFSNRQKNNNKISASTIIFIIGNNIPFLFIVISYYSSFNVSGFNVYNFLIFMIIFIILISIFFLINFIGSLNFENIKSKYIEKDNILDEIKDKEISVSKNKISISFEESKDIILKINKTHGFQDFLNDRINKFKIDNNLSDKENSDKEYNEKLNEFKIFFEKKPNDQKNIKIKNS